MRVAFSDEMSGAIRSFMPMIETLARRYEYGQGFGDRFTVEFDDLVQEGMIAAAEAIQGGHPVSKLTVEHSMIDWRRHCAYLQGQGASVELTEDVEE